MALTAMAQTKPVSQSRSPNSAITCTHEAELTDPAVRGPNDIVSRWQTRIQESSQRLRTFEEFRACFMAYKGRVDAGTLQMRPTGRNATRALDDMYVLLGNYTLHIHPDASGALNFTEQSFDPRQCDEYRRRLVTDLVRTQGCTQNPQTKALSLRGSASETGSIVRMDGILRLLCEGQLNANPCAP